MGVGSPYERVTWDQPLFGPALSWCDQPCCGRSRLSSGCVLGGLRARGGGLPLVPGPVHLGSGHVSDQVLGCHPASVDSSEVWPGRSLESLASGGGPTVPLTGSQHPP